MLGCKEQFDRIAMSVDYHVIIIFWKFLVEPPQCVVCYSKVWCHWVVVLTLIDWKITQYNLQFLNCALTISSCFLSGVAERICVCEKLVRVFSIFVIWLKCHIQNGLQTPKAHNGSILEDHLLPKACWKEGNDPLPVLFHCFQPSMFVVDTFDGVSLAVVLWRPHGWWVKMGHFEQGCSGGTFKLNFWCLATILEH